MDDLGEEVSRLTSDHPEASSAMRSILEVDREKEAWEFHDIPVDSGIFGEIVSRGIVERREDGAFELANRAEVERALGISTPGHSEEGSELISDHIELLFTGLGDRVQRLTGAVTGYRFVVLCSLLFAGFYLRVNGVGSPPMLDGEALFGLATRSYVETGAPTLPAGHPYNRGPLLTVLAGISMQLFADELFALRLPTVLAGTVSIPVVYLLGREVGDWTVGSLAAILQTFSLVSVAWSRTARFYAIFQVLLLAVVYSVLRLRQTSSIDLRGYRPVIAGRVSLAVHTVVLLVATTAAYFLHKGWILAPALVGLVMLLPNENEPARRRFAKLGSWILIGGFALPVIVFNLLPVPAAFFDLIGLGMIDGVEIWRHPITDALPVEFFFSYYPALTFLALSGILLSVYRGGDHHVLLIAFFAPLFFFTYFGTNFRPIWRPRYLLLILPYFFIFVAIALSAVKSKLGEVSLDVPLNISVDVPQRWNVSRSGFLVTVLTLLLLASPIVPDIGASTDPATLSRIEEPRPNYRGACDAMAGEVHSEDIVITNRPQQLHFWLGKTDYRANDFSSSFTWKPGFGHYTGAKIITNDTEMARLIQNNERIWVVYNPFMPLTGKEWITDNMDRFATIESSFSSRFPHGLYNSALADQMDDERVYIYTKGVGEVTPRGNQVSVRC